MIMKTLYALVISIFLAQVVHAQGIGINETGADPHPSAGLDVNFNNKGFVLPRLTSSQRDAIQNPVEGLQIYNSTTQCFEAFYGTFWQSIHCGCSIAPLNLVYTDNGPITYCLNQNVELNSPATEGGSPSSYTVSPALPAGLFLNTTTGQITGSPAAEIAASNYTFSASNACGSTTRVLTIGVNTLPSVPSAITGPSSPTFNTSVNYSTDAVSGASSYTWTVPGDWTISSGQGTTSINVTVGENSGNVSVTASNTCGISTEATAAVTSWRPITANGGAITNYTADGTNGLNGVQYRVHSFTTVGSSNLNVTDPGTDGLVDYLIVAGGGGGGFDFGGGGGAGGYRSSVMGEFSGRNTSPEPQFIVEEQSYTVSVGAGGNGGFSNDQSTNGQNSSFFGIVATGGGGGANGSGPRAYGPPKIGGSGGGGGGWDQNQVSGAAGLSNEGFDGGAGVQSNSTSSPYGAGGGGGAGQNGLSSPNNNSAGKGGDGIPSRITGIMVYRAGGGGGGTYPSTAVGGSGGLGGGGNGASGININGQNGSPNTGGGGGGNSGGGGTNTFGGAGGSGIVIVRYPITNPNL